VVLNARGRRRFRTFQIRYSQSKDIAMLAITAAQGASGCASRVNESNFNSVLAQLFARYRSERQPEHA
jgi:hypothetical protein